MARGALQRLASDCLSGRLAAVLKQHQQQQQAWGLLSSGVCGGMGSTCVGGSSAGLLRGGAAAAAPAGAAAAGACGSGVRHMGTGVEGMADKTLAKARRLAVAVGALAGVFGSLVGVGGGVLISPIIANACKSIPQRVISGTSLAAVVATGSSAGYVYWSSGAVDPTSAAVVAASAVALTPLGARATHLVDCATLRRLMAYWLFLVAPLVPLKPVLMKHYAGTATAAAADDGDRDGSSAAAGGEVGAAQQQGGADSGSSSSGGSGSGTVWRPLRSSDGVLAATGMLAGFASGLLGIGGGTVVTPLLTVATGLPQLNVLGTSLTAMVVPSLVGLAQHARLGNVDWVMAAGLAAGTLVGGGVGGKLAVNMPEGVLEWVFCLGMLYLGRKTLASVGAKAAGKGAAVAGTGPGAGTAGTGVK